MVQLCSTQGFQPQSLFLPNKYLYHSTRAKSGNFCIFLIFPPLVGIYQLQPLAGSTILAGVINSHFANEAKKH